MSIYIIPSRRTFIAQQKLLENQSEQSRLEKNFLLDAQNKKVEKLEIEHRHIYKDFQHKALLDSKEEQSKQLERLSKPESFFNRHEDARNRLIDAEETQKKVIHDLHEMRVHYANTHHSWDRAYRMHPERWHDHMADIYARGGDPTSRMGWNDHLNMELGNDLDVYDLDVYVRDDDPTTRGGLDVDVYAILDKFENIITYVKSASLEDIIQYSRSLLIEWVGDIQRSLSLLIEWVGRNFEWVGGNFEWVRGNFLVRENNHWLCFLIPIMIIIILGQVWLDSTIVNVRFLKSIRRIQNGATNQISKILTPEARLIISIIIYIFLDCIYTSRNIWALGPIDYIANQYFISGFILLILRGLFQWLGLESTQNLYVSALSKQFINPTEKFLEIMFEHAEKIFSFILPGKIFPLKGMITNLAVSLTLLVCIQGTKYIEQYSLAL
tara:strand:+ start:1324 stop:2640 length:1317 start_codon:yes stop_codon:yes gene_type:complete